MKTRLAGPDTAGEERQNTTSTQATSQLRRPLGEFMSDARAAPRAQLRHQELADNADQATQLKACASIMARQVAPLQRAENSGNTGLPNPLKSGIESLSAVSMDHVKVHYNSDNPSQLRAHAYAQGSEIHLAPGQERHLPHEAWHVVQQAQQRIRPTLQMKAGAVNDDRSLEKEADIMGEKAVQFEGNHVAATAVAEGRVPGVITPRFAGSAQPMHLDRLSHSPAGNVAQRARASHLDYSGYLQIENLAVLNTLLENYGHPSITLKRIYKRVNIGGDDTQVETLGGWPVREGIQDRFATRATAGYEPPVNAAINAMTTYFWKADVGAPKRELHMGDKTTPYREDQLIGDIRAALEPIINAMPVVTHYAESGYSVSLAALDTLRAQVPVITLQKAFDCLGHMINGHNWGGTKLLGNNADFAAELKINGSGATRLLSRNATPTVLDEYRLNGLH